MSPEREVVDVPATQFLYEHPATETVCLTRWPVEVCTCGRYTLQWHWPAAQDER